MNGIKDLGSEFGVLFSPFSVILTFLNGYVFFLFRESRTI